MVEYDGKLFILNKAQLVRICMATRVLYSVIALALVLGAGFFLSTFNTANTVTLNELRMPSNVVQYTFSTYSVLSALPNATVATIDGVHYSYSQMPAYEEFIPGTLHTYSFAATIPSRYPGRQYTLQYVTMCGVNSTSSGSFYATGPCTITAKYR